MRGLDKVLRYQYYFFGVREEPSSSLGAPSHFIHFCSYFESFSGGNLKEARACE